MLKSQVLPEIWLKIRDNVLKFSRKLLPNLKPVLAHEYDLKREIIALPKTSVKALVIFAKAIYIMSQAKKPFPHLPVPHLGPGVTAILSRPLLDPLGEQEVLRAVAAVLCSEIHGYEPIFTGPV